jgi:hypothetical protein
LPGRNEERIKALFSETYYGLKFSKKCEKIRKVRRVRNLKEKDHKFRQFGI